MAEERTPIICYGDNLGNRPEPKEPFKSLSWTTMRKRVLYRDGFQCQICGDAYPLAFDGALFVHHIVRRALGGSDNSDNLITLCDLCHGGVVHKYQKWLGVPAMSQSQRQDAKGHLLGVLDNYQWFLHLPREQMLRVQKEIWAQWGVQKRVGGR